ncbi:nucleotide exchange factor GrpE [Candidatus Sumerlaeota bacterium]|nr:nucleotide exchange factor GrpE [Candidatus Sumerlaeota bacterium]
MRKSLAARKRVACPYPFSPRRRKHRARRLRYNPHGKHRSHREESLSRSLIHTAHQHNRLNDLLHHSKREFDKMKKVLVDTRSDLEATRRRATREKEEAAKFGLNDFINALIPALDSFDHALDAIGPDTSDASSVVEGILAIQQQFEKALASQGIEKIQPLGETFDPTVHEALGAESTDEHPPNTVIQVIQAGYVLNGRLVRPARVRVAQKKS